MTRTTASLLALAAAVGGIAALLLMNRLLAASPGWLALQILAVGLMIWARVTFGRRSFHAAANPTAGGLVTTGPYRYIRHPIYAAATYLVWAGVLSQPTPEAIGAGIVVTLALAVRALLEEQLVLETYPEYKEYAAKTKRLIPFIF
jgi:protein-S-isoprenylcysteine O-methyltransferase Ste14